MIRPTELRVVWRMLRKNPGTSVLAVTALALGIGLTTSMFSIVHGLLMSRLPFADPGRLVDLVAFDEGSGPLGLRAAQVPVHDFVDWREQQTSFTDLAAVRTGNVSLNDEAGYPERYQVGFMTWNMLGVLGVEPVLGRGFSAGDDVPGAAPVVILGHDAWRDRWQGDRTVIGRAIRVDGEPTTVIGVMPPGFEFPTFQSLWMPLRLDLSGVERGQGGRVWTIGRLAEGVDIDQAQAEMATLSKRLAELYPRTNAGRSVLVRDYRASLNSDADTAITGVMLGAVSLVLLIACANVASLLLARSAARGKELAIRTALGARRGRVIGLVVVESLALSAVGSALGLALAHAGTTWLESAFNWQSLPFWISFGIRPPVVVFVVAAGLAAGLVSGLVPALKVSGAVSFDLLKDEARGPSGLRASRLSRVLVVAELAVACALVAVTGLMVRTVANYHQRDLGFATESIFTAELTLPESSYERADAVAFYQRLLGDLRELPDVESAAVMSRPPGTFMGLSLYRVEGETRAEGADTLTSPRGVVSNGFFETYGITVLEGRLFDRRDDADAPPVVIVNRSFAAQTWPGRSALGRRLRLGRASDDEPWREVVGVVPDAGVSLLNPAFVGTGHAGFYLPYAQMGLRSMSVAVKTRGEPAAFAATLRERVAGLDAGLPIADEKTMERVVWEQTFSTKVVTVVFSFFGLTALVLAAAGIFGVMMVSVGQRRPEIGLRLALGARPKDVLRMVLRQGLGRVAVGLGLGLGLAWGLGSAMRILLFGVEPGDPLAFAGTAVFLAGVALIACWVPAWRAARTDPLAALRHE